MSPGGAEQPPRTPLDGGGGSTPPSTPLPQAWGWGCAPPSDDMLAWVTGTRVGNSNHATELFCIDYGCILGFVYSDTLHFEV